MNERQFTALSLAIKEGMNRLNSFSVASMTSPFNIVEANFTLFIGEKANFMSVLVIDKNKKPLTPIHPGRARVLLKQGKAAVFRQFPFTIILKYEVETQQPGGRIKIDPGSKFTGIVIINDQTGKIAFACEIEHRGNIIKKNLEQRSNVRRGRRNKLRYRKPRFLNRTRKKGWLPPSLKSRVLNIETWVNRLMRYCPISNISMELVRFDMQQIENPEISGIEYQQGELYGYEVKEYLLEKWGRKCAYCGKENIPLEVEHIIPKSKGGSNKVSNLTIACQKCNQRKGSKPIEIFLKKKPDILKRIFGQAKRPLKDAAAVNATRWNLFQTLKEKGLPVECGSGGLTKFNRISRGIVKSHWADAACVGKSTPENIVIKNVKPLIIKARGQSGRQKTVLNKYGQPKQYRPLKPVFGWRSGDLAKFENKIVGVTPRKTGCFELIPMTGGKPFGRSYKKLVRIFQSDGYKYC